VTELKTTTSNSWTPIQAIALAAFSLLLGLCGGWLIRRSLPAHVSRTSQIVPAAVPNTPPQSLPASFSSVPAAPTAEQLKQAADSHAEPLLAQLKSDSSNAALLARLGNLYYGAKQYPAAIDYYQRSLKLQPADTLVRADLGTAYWYNGDADAAIGQFQRALSYEPNKANALFNLGIVKWKGKHDAAGAIADWQKLLASNPGFEERAKVEDLIAQAKESLEQKR